MPEPIAQRADPTPIIALKNSSLIANVGDLGQRGAGAATIGEHAQRRDGMQLSVQPLGEGHLLLASHGLIPEDKHCEPVEASSNLLEYGVILESIEGNPVRQGSEERVDLREPKGHA